MKSQHSHNSMSIWPAKSDPRRRETVSETSLRFALLCGTYLAGADFRGADLTGANLRDAIVDHRTDFRGAKLAGADVRAKGLSDAKFSQDTTYDDDTQFPSGFDPDVHHLKNARNT